MEERCSPFCVSDLELRELDKIQAIKVLLCVKYGSIYLPLFDVSQFDFTFELLCTVSLFLLTFICTFCMFL